MPADESRAKIERLEAALAALEAAVSRTVLAERTRADLSETLAVMEDDRQRLAHELDGALHRAQELETAAETVETRLRAMSTRLGHLISDQSDV